MSDILSQSEIEALLNSLAESEAKQAPVAGSAPTSAKIGSGSSTLAAKPTLGAFGSPTRSNTSRNAIAYEVYDFRRPDKFSKDQLRTLQMLHETFARHAATSLSAYLRTAVQIDLISLEQVPYEEYIRGINNSVFTVMALPPLTGQALLEIEFNVVFGMIDRLLGGPGRPISRTSLTDIERPLVRQMIERVFSGLKTAWETVVIVNPSIDQIETAAQFVQIAPPNDIVVTLLFEIKVGTMRGAMSVCIPYLVLKPITPKLSAQKWFVNNSRKNNTSNKKLLSWQVQNTNVQCSVLLGKTRVNTRDFLDLKVGDTIRLDQDAKSDLVLLVSKTPKFLGKPAISGKRMMFSVNKATHQEKPCL